MNVGFHEVVKLLDHLLSLKDCLHELLIILDLVHLGKHYVHCLAIVLQLIYHVFILLLDAPVARNAEQD